MRALSVIIPTRDRPAVLARTLLGLAGQDQVPGGCEILVVENGGSSTAAPTVQQARAAAHGRVELRVLHEVAPGPAAARNRGIASARGRVLLLLGDDTAPCDPGVLAGHVRAHAELHRPAAVLGTIRWRDPDPSPLMRWLDSGGFQFDFGALESGPVDIERHFYSSHVSIDAGILRAAGGFDARFTAAAMEDIELGWRLKRSGVELIYRPELVVEHDHPITYAESLARMRRIGDAVSQLMEIQPAAGAIGVTASSRLRAPLLRLASGLSLGARELPSLPSPLRELRWRVAHRDAFYRGYRRARAAR